MYKLIIILRSKILVFLTHSLAWCATSDCEKTDFLQKTILLKYILRLTGALSGSV